MVTAQHQFTLVNKLFYCLLIVVFAVLLASCDETSHVLGQIYLKDNEEISFDFNLPANPEKEIGWYLRFRVLSPNRIEMSKATDQVTVYLENNDSVPIEFRGQSDTMKIAILPGSKIKMFEGELSELEIHDPDSYKAMLFDPVNRSIHMKLYFVPRLEKSSSAAIRLVVFYNSDRIL